MISKINTYTFLIIATITSFFIMASLKTPTIGVKRESGWFGYIDDTSVIFLFLAIPFFLILLTYSIVGANFKKTNTDSYAHLNASQKALLYITHPLFIGIQLHLKFKQLLNKIGQSKFLKHSLLLVITIAAIYFFEHTAFISWHPYSAKANTIRNTIVIGAMMFIFNYLKHRHYFRRFDFWKAEFFKFSILFFGTIITLNIADLIAFSVDKITYSAITKSPFNDSPELIIIGLALAFAIANLFNNITQTYLNKHYRT